MKNAKQDGDYEKTLRRAGFQKLTLYKFTIHTVCYSSIYFFLM